jgi:class 3 adenylate cyclase
MQCSKCGNNPPTNNFCAKCGNALVLHCAKCNAENPPTSGFRGKCGARLKDNSGASAGSSAPDSASSVLIGRESISPEALEGERKTVTTLFADLKGSMELMEDLDPEEARAIVDPALKLMIDAAHRYGGYIVQSTGDGIFALFGAPVAHEEHPQRSLYPALRMQEDVKRYAEKLRAEKGVNLQVRVGVNTGEAVIRSIKTDEAHTEYTPIGHSTSLASRMQALAAPGSIAVTETLNQWLELRNKHSAGDIDTLYCRIRGELLLKAGSIDQAQESLRQSIQLSTSQSAKMEQLRASMPLAALLDQQGKRDEARAMLAEIYNWFTEGSDTADLKDAKALLDELGT